MSAMFGVVPVFLFMLNGMCQGQPDNLYNQYSPDVKSFLLLNDFQEYAEKYMPKKTYAYVEGGAVLEQTLHENRAGFFRLRLRHKLLRDTSKQDIRTTVLGHKLSMPIGFCPNALHGLLHPEGENVTARVAFKANTLMILSIDSTLSMEEVAAHSPRTMRWFNIVNFKSRNITEDLIRRAKKSGYSALVITADIQVTSYRVRAMREKFNFDDYSYGSLEKYKNYPKGDLDESPTMTWKDIAWMKSVTGLPVVVKGITTAEDGEKAVKYGADAIIVSTHGGRQLDGSPASIEALPEVVKAVKGRIEVYFDSGIRTGTDVIKALALGARTVFIGRPNLFALYAAGEKGSERVLQILTDELKNSMHLIGAANNSELDYSYVQREEYYRIPF